MNNNNNKPNSPISNESMDRLAKIMNDTPSLIKLNGTEWEIRGLKLGTQWLIAEEACKIVDKENMSMGDVIKQFAVNMPAVCRVFTLALLNDKEKIYGKEYQEVYDLLMWGNYNQRDWALMLSEVVDSIDIDFFFASINVVKMLRQRTLNRKITTEEQK